jgi:hypothetical protein
MDAPEAFLCAEKFRQKTQRKGFLPIQMAFAWTGVFVYNVRPNRLGA